MGYSLSPIEEIKIEVEAYVYGGLGLHKCFANESLYTLTHIKSGMSLNSYKMRKEQAMHWLVESAGLTDWTGDVSFLSSETARHILAIALMARRIVQESEQAS
jgi:hypothetical protein